MLSETRQGNSLNRRFCPFSTLYGFVLSETLEYTAVVTLEKAFSTLYGFVLSETSNAFWTRSASALFQYPLRVRAQ